MADTEAAHFLIRDRVWYASDSALQTLLALVHASGERPRCLCVPDGVEMYVARHQRYLVKRMPDTGHLHHPGCTSWEPDAQSSGLGRLMGDAVRETEPGRVELRVGFAWSRLPGRAVERGESGDAADVAVPRPRMSLRALLHLLFERAGFNRWTPAMAGKRNQGVLHKYLLEAAADITVQGLPLRERLYVPEPFSEAAKADIARRRHEKLALLQPRDGRTPLALLVGEFKTCQQDGGSDGDGRIWVRHLPDAPLRIDARSWQRVVRAQGEWLDARDADTGHAARVAIAALIHARRAFTYEIDTVSLMLVSTQWIPVDGVHELPLIDALVQQQRRFVKPLRYDAKSAAPFPNALLLDCGTRPIPLHLTHAFMTPQERTLKDTAIQAAGEGTWVWHLGEAMPALPPAHPRPGLRPQAGAGAATAVP
ncbi:MAG: hypothetical protein DI587_03600 [Variovorax paradoxus]|nr:MAG: hypothetical protein DI583_03600 [Variovorax paradoxus]PZQ15162.1 MAG: hypothetical protein DI587_03600 [Variovorax paradoxus]